MKIFNTLLVIFFSIVVAACGGGGSSSPGAPASNKNSADSTSTVSAVTTIPSMPYAGSVTGASDSYYQYTTVGTVGTISATGLTNDIDPRVYTSAAFTTLSTNWTCTYNTATTADSCTAATPVPAGTTLYIKARNYAGASGTFTLSVAAAGLTTTTITSMPYNGSVTGTNDSFYIYTTVGTVGTISATGLTNDIDPMVYTNATFSTQSTNWTCTMNIGTAADSCTAVTPVPAGTTLYIKARNWAGTSSSFTLSVPATTGAAPTITSFTPTSGATGSSVTITGTNFSATAASNTVKFNGVTATVTSATATSLTVTVPATATTGTISVTTAGGTGTSATNFTVGAAGTTPTISSFTPTSGATGSSVTITGTNFSATAASNTVKFNGVTATVTGATTTSLTVTVPATATSGTISVTTAGGTATSATSFFVATAGVTTIASMPYNGSVTGANSSSYQYATVGTVGTISATGLTSDIDPLVYTSAAFTTLSANWTCTANPGTMADSCTATTPVAAGTVLYIKALNFAAVSGTFTLSVSAPAAGGATTLTTSFGNITGLTYNAALSNSGTTAPTTYSRIWTNAGDMLNLLYLPSATEDVLSVAFTSGVNSYWAGTPTTNFICHVSGANPLAWPTCASWGITVSRAAGTISFASTPAFNDGTNATGTISGSFTFTAF